MCGIVGLLVRRAELRPALGKLLVPMFECMAERGPDSAGVAVFSESDDGELCKVSLHAPSPDYDWASLEKRMALALGDAIRMHAHGNHALFVLPREESRFREWLAAHEPAVRVLSVGRAIEVWKDEGNPRAIVKKYAFSNFEGSHAIGHTRMATESRVSPAHAHPYTAGRDFCLVHNGSLSNPYMLRRRLEAVGVPFETDNDTEAACRYLEWRLSLGDDLERAIGGALVDLDGFFTLLIGTRERMTLVRDPVACKPAIVAETPDYVAVASEFRSLAHLPGIENAKLFEPLPARIYSWTA
jgi:glutamate synthase domain-containing protein 1